MSKKERKMAKQRAKLDKELLEAKAEESTQTRYLQYLMSVITSNFKVTF